MQKVVTWAVSPRLDERLCLCCQDRSWQKNTLLYAVRNLQIIIDFSYHTGRLVVPDVYSIIPPWLPTSSVSSTVDSWCASPVNLLRKVKVGVLSRPSFVTSSVFERNFSEDKSAVASLFSRIYLNSDAGKPGDRGRAIESLARHESNVTASLLIAPTSASADHYQPT